LVPLAPPAARIDGFCFFEARGASRAGTAAGLPVR